MNSKMTVNSQLSKTESKKIKTKNKQLEQEKNQRTGDHIEGYQWGGGGRDGGREVQEIRSIIGRHQIDGSR